VYNLLRVHLSCAPALYGCYKIVQYDLLAVWCCVGNAVSGERDVGDRVGGGKRVTGC